MYSSEGAISSCADDSAAVVHVCQEIHLLFDCVILKDLTASVVG